jgi:mono/diheme cytochrome c family protein
MKTLKKLFLCALLILVLAACSGQSSEISPAATQPEATASTPPAAAGEVSFAADVLPIFEDSCTRCHGSSRQNGGLRLDSYAALMAGGTDGAVIVPNDAAGSWLVALISSGEMPKNAADLSPAEITRISEWIDAGAADN